MPQALIESGIVDKGSVYAERGTLQHGVAEALDKGELNRQEYSQRVLAKDVELNLTEWVDVQDSVRMMKEYLDQYPSTKFRDYYEQQVGFTDDWRTDCFGTADRTRLDLTNRKLFVFDHKFGQVKVSAENNSQCMIYALASIQTLVAKGVGVDKIVDSVVLGISQPKCSKVLDTWEITLGELYKWDKTVLQPAQRAVLEGGKFNAGDHCSKKYCKLRSTCSTYRQMIGSVMDDFMEEHYLADESVSLDGPIADMTPEELSTFMLNFKRVEKAYELVFERAKGIILAGGEVPDFKPVAGRGSNDWADEEAAEKYLANRKLKKADRCPMKLLSPAQAKNVLKAMDVFDEKKYDELVKHTKGEPTIAHVSDRRKALEIVVEDVEDMLSDFDLDDLGELGIEGEDIDIDDLLNNL
jgi:hypothetical protein